jgi:hypothetical protein
VASSALNSLGQVFGLRASQPAVKDWWIEAEQLANRAASYVLGRAPPIKQSFLEQSKEYLGDTLFGGSTSLSSSIATIILTFLILLSVFMSWSTPFKSWGGRFSPFGRTNQTTDGQVTDQDFSYITSEDIKRTRPARETDAVVLKHKRVNYPVHFPSYSIDDGELKIGKIRQEAAHRLSLAASEAGRVKLFYKGKNLKDDSRTARDEGMRSDVQAEILVSLGEHIAVPDDDEEDEEEEMDNKGDKKKKNRKRKKKSGRASNSGTATPDASRTHAASTSTGLNPDATFAPSRAPPPRSMNTTPKPVQTPMEKIEALASHFHTTLVPPCITYISNPPTEPAKLEFEHKRLSETILAQILLKLDAVETEGNDEARQSRKALVKEVQGMLNKLDEVVQKD